MNDEIPLNEPIKEPPEKILSEEEKNLFSLLEERVHFLLTKYRDLKKERDQLAEEVEEEREKRIRLEKKVELFTQDRERVKGKIDQLLHRLRSIDE